MPNIRRFIIVNLFNFLNIISGYNICIAGSSSGLGRELIYQSMTNSENTIYALTNNPDNIKIPYRGGGLANKETTTKLVSDNLIIDNYNNFNKYKYDNIVFTMGGKAFDNDYSDKITECILKCYDNTFKNIILISALGVGDSLQYSNVGIKTMNNWYLKDVYRAKNYQELLVKQYKERNKETEITILRPGVLSYGYNIYNGIPREKLASNILSLIEKNKK